MELQLQFGYGMMEHCRFLISSWVEEPRFSARGTLMMNNCIGSLTVSTPSLKANAYLTLSSICLMPIMSAYVPTHTGPTNTKQAPSSRVRL